jgi:alpha-glucosidase
LLTLRGTLTLYYGDENGMQDAPVSPEAARDPWEKREPDLGLGRDPQCVPMQWNGSRFAGFTTGRPWLPVATDYGTINVAAEQKGSASILSLYRNLIALLALDSSAGARIVSRGARARWRAFL